jgi:hypothetical protein
VVSTECSTLDACETTLDEFHDFVTACVLPFPRPRAVVPARSSPYPGRADRGSPVHRGG